MSKFKIFVIIFIFTLFVAGLFVWQYVSSLHQVSFTVTKGLTTNIYKVINNNNQQTFKTINDSVKLSLQNGNYCAQPTDKNYDDTAVCFTVNNKDISVSVEPNNSTAYLANLLPVELSKIQTVVNEKYSAIIGNFTQTTGALYGHGEWYGGTLTQNVQYASDQGDVYRFILHKVNSVWQIVAFPQITVNKYDYPNVPYSVLDAVNHLVGTQS